MTKGKFKIIAIRPATYSLLKRLQRIWERGQQRHVSHYELIAVILKYWIEENEPELLKRSKTD